MALLSNQLSRAGYVSQLQALAFPQSHWGSCIGSKWPPAQSMPEHDGVSLLCHARKLDPHAMTRPPSNTAPGIPGSNQRLICLAKYQESPGSLRRISPDRYNQSGQLHCTLQSVHMEFPKACCPHVPIVANPMVLEFDVPVPLFTVLTGQRAELCSL